MATIYLDNFFKPRESLSNQSTPESFKKIEERYTYTDLHLDIENNFIQHSSFKSNQNDIRVDYDSQAVRNSIRNILTTRPYSKIYSPTFGSKLESYLFEGISEFRASLIGREINSILTKYEPRINITSITVFPNFNSNSYSVQLEYSLVDNNLIDTLEILLQAKTIGSTTFVNPQISF